MSPKAKVFVKIYFFKFSTSFVKLMCGNKKGTGVRFQLLEHHISLRLFNFIQQFLWSLMSSTLPTIIGKWRLSFNCHLYFLCGLH